MRGLTVHGIAGNVQSIAVLWALSLSTNPELPHFQNHDEWPGHAPESMNPNALGEIKMIKAEFRMPHSPVLNYQLQPHTSGNPGPILVHLALYRVLQEKAVVVLSVHYIWWCRTWWLLWSCLQRSINSELANVFMSGGTMKDCQGAHFTHSVWSVFYRDENKLSLFRECPIPEFTEMFHVLCEDSFIPWLKNCSKAFTLLWQKVENSFLQRGLGSSH